MRHLLALSALAIVLVGCGGSGGGTTEVTPTPETPLEKGTALFKVDVASGKVKVVPLEAATGKTKSAVLGGNAVSFTTSTLLSEGGELGRRVIKVQLKNNLAEAIGVDRPIRLQFGVFGPLTSYPTDLRAQSTVSTLIKDLSPGFADGPVGSAHISNPTGTAIGADGAIYFSGTDNRVRRLQDGYVSTVAQNVPASGLAYLKDPSSGREYLVASCAPVHSIKLVPISTGSVTTWAGLDATSGNVNGAPATARFNQPQGIAVDPGNGQILVADAANGAVRAIPFSFSGGNLVAGTVSTRYSGLTNPYYVAVSTNKTVGVTEASVGRVRLFNAGSSKEAIIGTGTSGNVVGDGNISQFGVLGGITAIGDTFFVSDTTNYQIKRIALKNGAAPLLGVNWRTSYVAGTGVAGSTDGLGTVAQFVGAIQIATDSQGRIVVADQGGNSIRRIVTNGSFDFGTPDGSGTGTAKLTNYSGFVDLNGLHRPYIDLNQRLEPGQSVEIGEWQFSIPETVPAFSFAVTVETGTSAFAGLEGVTNATAGPGSPNVVAQYLSRSGNDSAATGKLDNVAFDGSTTYLTTDASGVVYAADAVLKLIRRIDRDGTVTLIAGKRGVSGNTSGNGDDARFSIPNDLSVNPEGTELFVSDETDHSIRRIALSNGGNPRIASHWFVSTIAGGTGSGDTNGSGDLAKFKGPVSVTGPSNDDLYVTEYGGSRLRHVKYIGGPRELATSWQVSVAAGSPTAVSGYIDGSAGSSLFSSPVGAEYSPEGIVYVADRGNARIRAFNIAANTVSTVAGDGTAIVKDNVNGLLAGFAYLSGVTVDRSGAVYIGDNGRIRRLLDGGVKTVAGGGDGSGTSGDKVVLGANFGITTTPQGDLLLNSSGRLVRLTRKLGR